MGKITKGTKQWATSNVNIYLGCSNACEYCYSKRNALRFSEYRKKHGLPYKTVETWCIMTLNEKALNKNYKKRQGRIMFPTSHDITRETLENCIVTIKKLIRARNDVLITTKPRLLCVQRICEEIDTISFVDKKCYEKQVQFRFTITSIDNEKLKLWEPGAPAFEERLNALQFAFEMGFETSISIEPCLDPDPRPLIKKLRDFVTGTIWIGPMNYNGKHDFNSKETLHNWVKWFENDPKIKLKDTVYNKLKIKKKKVMKMGLNDSPCPECGSHDNTMEFEFCERCQIEDIRTIYICFTCGERTELSHECYKYEEEDKKKKDKLPRHYTESGYYYCKKCGKKVLVPAGLRHVSCPECSKARKTSLEDFMT